VKQNFILNRALEPRWLDAALHLAIDTDEFQGAKRDLLGVMLADDIKGPMARAKTVTALSRVWLDPAETARAMLQWAAERSTTVVDARVLHLGALLATHRFFGDCCAAVGRTLGLHESVLTPEVRQRVKARWGDREAIDVSVRAAIRTLRAFGVLVGAAGDQVSSAGERLAVPLTLRPWLAHALLLTRGQTSWRSAKSAVPPNSSCSRPSSRRMAGYESIRSWRASAKVGEDRCCG
jgi:hypothetical protein